MTRYNDTMCVDGPQAGKWVPFHGYPRYGHMVLLERHVDGGLFRRPRNCDDVYTVSGDSRSLIYRGTLA